MLFRDKKIKVEIGRSITISDDDGRHQELPMKFWLPIEVAETLLWRKLDDLWDRAEGMLLDPKISGRINGHDMGPYKLSLWQHAENPAELEIHLAQPPIFEVEGVTMYKLTVSGDGEDAEFNYIIKLDIEIPWRDKDQAGEIDVLAGQTMHAQLMKAQTEMDIDN